MVIGNKYPSRYRGTEFERMDKRRAWEDFKLKGGSVVLDPGSNHQKTEYWNESIKNQMCIEQNTI